jgi:Ca-activated chloride channel family protein
VKRAASEFLLSITSSKDSVGIAAFNTRYALLKAPARDLSETAKAMDRLAKPADDQGYTELYASLVLASRDLGALRGRKALVVLSDGRNFPYFEKSGKASPAFGTKAFAAEESLDEAIRQGVTIFAVNFGPDKDSRLAELALRSGGEVFDARDSAELANIYASIRGKILTEILVEYKASMFSGDKRWVKLAYGPKGPGGEETARYYYSGTVFGRSFAGLSLWFLILVPLALLGLYGISLLRFEKPSVSANLSLLYAPGIGKGTKMFAVGERTVIGSDETADITITGNSRLQASPVTIVKDPTTGRFTIQSGESLTVNNRSVAKKTLEPGDVINFNGTIAVFDDADMTTLRKTKGNDPKARGKK